MGQRANILVVERGRRTLNYDHWCANRLDVELAWGPELGLRFARSLREVDEPDGWLDEVWCEGAAVIDADAKELLLLGGEDVLYDVPLRRAHLRILERAWTGWQVRWAHEGVASIADRANIPRAVVLVSDDEVEAPFGRNPGYPDGEEVLLTRRERCGALTVTRAAGLWPAVGLGPEGLVEVLERDVRRLDAWSADFPRGGVHVDVAAREVLTWWAEDTPALVERAGPGWAGWRFVALGDRFETHLERVAGAPGLPRLDPASDLDRAFAPLEARVHTEGRNHARSSLAALGGCELSPWTDCAQGSAGDPRSKRALLDRLRAPLRDRA